MSHAWNISIIVMPIAHYFEVRKAFINISLIQEKKGKKKYHNYSNFILGLHNPLMHHLLCGRTEPSF